MPVPLDEYPVHQIAQSMGQVGTSDRNFYDRCYFNAHDCDGGTFLVTGMGAYPNLGVADAYAAVAHHGKLRVLRCSDALDDDRLHPHVGPYRVEVIEPLHKIRLICEGQRVAFDLTWEGSFACIDEPRHLLTQGDQVIIDGCRFAQLGTWAGSLEVDGHDLPVSAGTWVGSRDRSWGIRPVGEPTPPGRFAAEAGMEGFWWLYVPLRFEDFAVVTILQEDPTGHRSLMAASRVWADGRHEQLGWPEVDITYRSGSRHPLGARLRFVGRRGAPLEIDVTTLASVPLSVGTGYGGDPEWGHGRWMGKGWLQELSYDLGDPAVASRIPFSVVDHVARATCDGAVGWGLFEHASMGRHDPSGFASWESTA